MTFADYSTIIRGAFLAEFGEIKDSTLKWLHLWRVEALVAIEMIGVSKDPNQMPCIPEATAMAQIRQMQCQAIADGYEIV